MSLDWSIKDCNFTDQFQKDHWTVIEDTIWSTMLVDMGKITKENISKYEFRLRCYMRASGNDYSGVVYFLPNMIGLSTNVYTTTDKAFEKKLLSIIIYDCQYMMKVDKTKRGQHDKRVSEEITEGR